MRFLYLLLIGLILIFGCAQAQADAKVNTTNKTIGEVVMESKVVKTGSIVTVEYVGTLDNGTVFDTSIESVGKEAGLARTTYEPFTFTVGSGQVIEGFDQGVIGMKISEEKKIHIESDEAYGPRLDNYIITVGIANISGGENMTVGGIIYANEGQQEGKITAIENGTATIDFNHPLAGKGLNFKLIVKNIQ